MVSRCRTGSLTLPRTPTGHSRARCPFVVFSQLHQKHFQGFQVSKARQWQHSLGRHWWSEVPSTLGLDALKERAIISSVILCIRKHNRPTNAYTE